MNTRPQTVWANHRGASSRLLWAKRLSLSVGSMLFTHAWMGLASGATAFWEAAVAGYNVGYCAYELLHWVHHATHVTSGAPKDSELKSKADLQEHHHFFGPHTNYRFVTTFWERSLLRIVSLSW